MRRIHTIVIGFAAGLVLTFGLANAPVAQTITPNLNHEMTATIADSALQEMSAAVEERTDGRIRIAVHSRGELGSERQMFDLMEVGGVEMGLSGAAIISAVAPEYGVLDMPYAIVSPEHLHRITAGPIGEQFREAVLNNKKIRILGWMDRAPRHLTTQGRAVRTPEDMRGLKIRVREIPVQVQAFRALGASPLPMAFGEVYTALQTGTIDAQENPLDVINGSSFYEVQDHLILTGHVREVQWVFASDVWWQTLSQEDQQVIEEAAQEFMAWGQERIYEDEERLLGELRNRGMEVVELTPEELAEFQKAVSAVPEAFADVWLPGLYEQVVEAAN